MIRVYENPSREEWPDLIRRPLQQENDAVRQRVEEILERVRRDGDDAVYELTREIDGVDIYHPYPVSESEIRKAGKQVDPELKKAILTASRNIAAFHKKQRMKPVRMEKIPGVICEQRSVPITRVGLYIPGGSAPLFSTVLMLAIPARLAGCQEIILCTPPGKDFQIAPEILWTAAQCGVDRIYKVGGAQAIAAMAYGTNYIGKVDKIFGPGNRYVTMAKQLVGLRDVAIDMPAGPSEVLVIADDTARADFIAADLLSQAEHGEDSQAILITTSKRLAYEVQQQVERQAVTLGRSETIRKSLRESRVILTEDKFSMLWWANEYAAEHLIVQTADPENDALFFTNAGSVFLGPYSPESVGDYASGTNHTLPTSGWARSYSGVNLDSFCKKITYQQLTAKGLQKLGPTVETMAAAEGLDAHKNAVSIRLKTL